MYLVASPTARGLFHQPILESAYMVSTPEFRERRFGEEPEKLGVRLAARPRVDSIAGLRGMDAATITERAPSTGYLPFGTIDGMCCRASWLIHSIAVSRRMFPCWLDSIAVKSVRCAFWRRSAHHRGGLRDRHPGSLRLTRRRFPAALPGV